MIRSINRRGLSIIKKWEGILDGNPKTVNLDPYLDPIGIWTIGWGHVVRDVNGQMLRGLSRRKEAEALFPNGITLHEAELLLKTDILEASKDVSRLVKVAVSDNQYSALVSFEFNTGALSRSTLLKRLNNGDLESASNEFLRWVKGRDESGKLIILKGLVNRRKEERELFLA